MDIKIPYTEMDLKIALLKISDEMLEKISQLKSDYVDENTSLLDHMSKHYGISKEILINSPNYDTLKKDTQVMLVNKLIQQLMALGCDDKQAWGVVAMSLGVIND